MTRREFLTASAAASLVTAVGCAEYAGSRGQAGLPEERDLIITGVRAAIDKTLLPALTQRVYPGHFTVTAIRFKSVCHGPKARLVLVRTLSCRLRRYGSCGRQCCVL